MIANGGPRSDTLLAPNALCEFFNDAQNPPSREEGIGVFTVAQPLTFRTGALTTPR
jgi:hypothetical protein